MYRTRSDYIQGAAITTLLNAAVRFPFSLFNAMDATATPNFSPFKKLFTEK
jgi:hypothetical protein